MDPTVQVHVALPAASVVFGSRPCALLGPLLYVTVMLHEVFGPVTIVTEAVRPLLTGLVTETKRTLGVVEGRDVVGAAVAVRALVGAVELVLVVVVGAVTAGAAAPACVAELPHATAKTTTTPRPHLTVLTVTAPED